MLKEEKEILQKFYNLKLPSELKNEDYDFIYDNTLLAGLIKSVLSGNYNNNNINLKYFLTNECSKEIQNVLIKYSNSQEIVTYLNYFNMVIKILDKLFQKQ